jgi:hypothetical protein
MVRGSSKTLCGSFARMPSPQRKISIVDILCLTPFVLFVLIALRVFDMFFGVALLRGYVAGMLSKVAEAFFARKWWFGVVSAAQSLAA